jgi:hypothetical protein
VQWALGAGGFRSLSGPAVTPSPRVGPESEARAAAWLAAERSDKPGQHLYGAEMFGLDPDALRGRFAGYIDRFQIPVGGAGSSAARLALGG